jgi:hypothetical protein
MENRRNYYRILHIQPDAPRAIIKASYRTQMQKLRMHPDLGGDEWNAHLLNEAYQILRDPDRRRAYDKEYFAGGDNRRQPAASRARNTRRSSPRNPFNRHFAADPSTCPFCKTVKPVTSAYAGPGNCPGCEAPLEVANTLRLADSSKRAIERICHREAVTVYLTPGVAGQAGMIRDLSPNGMQLQFGLLLREHQVIRLACTALSATGRVTFCNRDTSGEHFVAGVEFLTLRFRERSGTFLSVSA